jgi:hypothetical protein
MSTLVRTESRSGTSQNSFRSLRIQASQVTNNNELACHELCAMTTARIEQSGLAAADDLRAAMQGRVVSQGDSTCWDVRQIWNGGAGHEPSVFALCATVGDVQAAMRIAGGLGRCTLKCARSRKSRSCLSR